MTGIHTIVKVWIESSWSSHAFPHKHKPSKSCVNSAFLFLTDLDMSFHLVISDEFSLFFYLSVSLNLCSRLCRTSNNTSDWHTSIAYNKEQLQFRVCLAILTGTMKTHRNTINLWYSLFDTVVCVNYSIFFSQEQKYFTRLHQVLRGQQPATSAKCGTMHVALVTWEKADWIQHYKSGSFFMSVFVGIYSLSLSSNAEVN